MALRFLLGCTMAGVLAAAVGVQADRGLKSGTTLARLGALKSACRRANQGDRRRVRLWAVVVPPDNWRFGRYAARKNQLRIDTSRNIPVFDGAAELLPAGLEPVGFAANADRARKLRKLQRQGARLRVGFFLGFDNPHRTPCLVRSDMGVTTVRMEVAFVELLSPDGKVMARSTTDRFRAWADDQKRLRIPGEGPRGAPGSVTVVSGHEKVPEAWQQAFNAAHRGALGEALARCHEAGMERGAAKHGQVVVRLAVDAASVRVQAARVELSTIGDEAQGECIADALQEHLKLPKDAGPVSGRVELRVPVYLAAD